MKHLFFIILLITFVGHAGDYWVQNTGGNDEASGAKDMPWATIDRGLRDLKPGDTLHVLPGKRPYPGDIRIEHLNGAPDAPIIIDGHGSIVSGWKHLPASEWKDEGDGIFSRPLPNNAWGMQHYWEGGFDLVSIDGKPGRNVTSREALTPGSYFLYKNQQELKTDPLHNTLFIQLPAGKTPDDIRVEGIAHRGGIYVAGSYITVRNFITEYGGADGFSTHRNKGIVFEHIEARYFMDQGMSHHGAEVTVRHGWFHHNAGCGVVDVYPESVTRYENCLIEDDTWRGGVEFYSGKYEMVNCIIRNNAAKAMVFSRKGTKVTLRNCLISGEGPGVRGGDLDAELTLDHCTLSGFTIGLQVWLQPGSRLTMNACKFVDCKISGTITTVQKLGEEPVPLEEALHVSGNDAGDSWKLTTKIQREKGWAVHDQPYPMSSSPASDAGATVETLSVGPEVD